MHRYIWQNKKRTALYAVLMGLSSLVVLIFPFILSELVNSAVERDLVKLLYLVAGGLVYTLLGTLISFAYEAVKNSMKTDARLGIKKDLFRSVLRKDVQAFERVDSDEYINDYLQNLDVFESLYLDPLLEIPNLVFSFVLAAITCLLIEPLMVILIVLLGVVSFLVIKVMTKRLEKKTEHFTEEQAVYHGEIAQNIRCFRMIRTFGIMDRVSGKHHEKSARVERSKRAYLNEQRLVIAINNITGLGSTVLIMAAASYFAIRGHFSTGIVIAFGHLAGQIIGPIMGISDLIIRLKSAKGMKEKYSELTSGAKDLGAEGTAALTGLSLENGDIEVRNLRFYRGERQIFDGLGFLIQKNKKHLIVGGNGSGKSTLLMLLLGQYGEYSGEILYNGVNIREADRSTISDLAAYVSQEVMLFDDSLYNNITLYREYPEEEVQRVVRLCLLEEFVKKQPDGLQTQVKDGGKNFSGGEKQKINLARALIRNVPILVLDEISANMDNESTAQVERIVLAQSDKTVIAVSHKLSDEVAREYDTTISLSHG